MKRVALTKRQEAIQELIKAHDIEDQAHLLELLKSQYGIDTNQAAISRDLRALGIFKRTRGNVMVYDIAQSDATSEILHYAVKAIENAVKAVMHNETMIVIHTLPGTSALVGDFLDAQRDLGILGTLAGENVVFVIPRSIKTIGILSEQISQRLKLKE